MSAENFSETDVSRRLLALLDGGSGSPSRVGSVAVAAGEIAGHPVMIATTDRQIAGGSIGVEEARFLMEFLATSRVRECPLVVYLDSAGAKLSDGLPALGTFRELFRLFLDLRLSGHAMLAMFGRDCFGGAAMLASAATLRVFNPNTRLAMSGPAVMQVLGHEGALSAETVKTLMGGETRARINHNDRLCADTAEECRAAAIEFLEACSSLQKPDLHLRHNELGKRLLAQGIRPGAPSDTATEVPSILKEILPRTLRPQDLDGVFVARPDNTSRGLYLGFLGGKTVGAAAAWTMAGECLAFTASHPGESVTLFLDSPGHAPTIADERLGLSDYIAHLALVLAHLRLHGHRLTLQVAGEAAGGIYVALAAPATRVVALPGANVQVLPPAAMSRIIGRTGAKSDADDFLRAGVIDTLV